MAKDITLWDNSIVKKSNLLARASWSTTSVWECRLTAIVSAQVRKEDKDFLDYQIPIHELLKAAGIELAGGNTYREIISMARQTTSRTVELEEGLDWTCYTLFSKCRYTKGEKNLIVQFHPDMKSHYLDLKDHFTIYPLSEYLKLPSIYSQKIYELLRSWDNCPITDIPVSYLHKMLCTPPSLRKTFTDFSRRVLQKAHKDINNLTHMKYEWEALSTSGKPMKRGRKVDKIRFKMGKKLRSKKKVLQQHEAQEKKRKEQERQRKLNNQIAIEVVKCREQHQGDCNQCTKSTAHFEICESFKQ